MAAYSFTSKPIATALLEAHRKGVDVEVVVDRSNATDRYTAATFLANEGVPVRVDYRYAIMHDKYMVIDRVSVETGSFNYTQSASERNAENAIVIHDASVAEKYDANWEGLWAESTPMARRY